MQFKIKISKVMIFAAAFYALQGLLNFGAQANFSKMFSAAARFPAPNFSASKISLEQNGLNFYRSNGSNFPALTMNQNAFFGISQGMALAINQNTGQRAVELKVVQPSSLQIAPDSFALDEIQGHNTYSDSHLQDSSYFGFSYAGSNYKPSALMPASAIAISNSSPNPASNTALNSADEQIQSSRQQDIFVINLQDNREIFIFDSQADQEQMDAYAFGQSPSSQQSAFAGGFNFRYAHEENFYSSDALAEKISGNYAFASANHLPASEVKLSLIQIWRC